MPPTAILVAYAAAFGLAISAGVQPGAGTLRRPSKGDSAGQLIPLVALVDARTDTLWGMSNVFFTARPGTSLPAGAQALGAPELVDVIENALVKPVLTVRWRGADSAWVYAVDTDGDSSFTDEAALVFHTAQTASGAIQVADFRARVRARGATRGTARTVPMQLLSAGEYSYARPREVFLGMWDQGGRRHAVRVRPRGRQGVLAASLADVDIAIDLDNNGAFRTRRDPVDEAALLEVEDVTGRPFVTGGRAWQVTDATHGNLRLSPASKDTRTASEGFRAPSLFADVVGAIPARVNLTRAVGDTLTVVEFWATSCPFSEMARPALNALRAELAGAPIRWYSVARDRGAAAIDSALTAHPRSLSIAHIRWADWLRFNPRTVTPTYLLLDARGTVLLREEGGARVPVLRAAVMRAARVGVRKRPVP